MEQDNRIVKVSPDGSKTYIPKEGIDLPSLTKDVKARVAVALTAGGVLACGALNMLNSVVLYCDSQKDFWQAMGYRITTLDCVQHGIPYAFSHIFSR